MQTETSRPTSGTKTDRTCRNCNGTGRITDTVCAAITHRSRTVQRKCRYCKGTGQLAPIAPPAVDDRLGTGEIPAWMLGIDDEPIYDLPAARRRNTETVKASELRDGDTIVNSAGGDIPVLMATRYGPGVMIWTKPDDGFFLSPNLLVDITARRGDEDDNRDFTAAASR